MKGQDDSPFFVAFASGQAADYNTFFTLPGLSTLKNGHSASEKCEKGKKCYNNPQEKRGRNTK